MSGQLTLLQAIISRFDDTTSPFNENDISNAIQEIDQSEGSAVPIELMAEKMAFDFHENYNNDAADRHMYYGPMIELTRDDGTTVEYPSISMISLEILEYWATRAINASHPIMKARYADLVWEFSKVIRGIAPDVQMAQIAIDNRLQLAERNLHKYEMDTIQHLNRGLTLAASLSDTKRFEEIRDAIVAYEDKIAEDNKLGTWGFSYDLLIRNSYKKFALPNALEWNIVNELESRLGRLIEPGVESLRDSRVHGAEKAATCLASYYRRRNQPGDVKRVLTDYYTAFNYLTGSDEPGIVSIWLQRTHETFLQYSMNEEAEEIAVALRDAGGGAVSELKPVSVETEVSVAELEEYVAAIIDGELQTALTRTAFRFVPRRNEAQKDLDKLAKDYPISFLIPKQLLDYEGRPVASIGSLEEDPEGNIVYHISQTMVFSTFFLREILTSAVTKFSLSAQSIVDYLFLSPFFVEDKRTIIKKGIQAYLEEDFITAIHLLIPQIEASIRKMAELSGIPILKRNRNGAMQYKLLDELLRDERMVEMLGTDMAHYLKVILTDLRGWNLRNTVCHGMIPEQDFGYGKADRIVHSLLCLALYRLSDTKDLAEGDQSNEGPESPTAV